jgi:hypothetical protein
VRIPARGYGCAHGSAQRGGCGRGPVDRPR